MERRQWGYIGLLMLVLTLEVVRGQTIVTSSPALSVPIVAVEPSATSALDSMTIAVSSTEDVMMPISSDISLETFIVLTQTVQPPTPTVMPMVTSISSMTSTTIVSPSTTIQPMPSPTSSVITSISMQPTMTPPSPTTTEEVTSTNFPTTGTTSGGTPSALTDPPSPPSPSSGFPEAAIYAIAAGGGALLIIAAIVVLICCCCCCGCCACNKSEDYVPDKPFMVVRTYDQNFAPDLGRSGSLISNRSRGNSMRSSISSIASSIRSSIRRLSRRNRAITGGDGQIAMKVTPL